MASPIIIAIDGPSAGGKGTIAKRLAAQLGYAHLDTGLLYRAMGYLVLHTGGNPEDVEAARNAAPLLNALVLEIPELREDRIAVAASKVAAIPFVREYLLGFQKDFCENPPGGKPGAVLDGRDIGTVIAPNAPVKIYVTASTEVRAKRRFDELQKRGEKTSYEAVLKDMQERDARDGGRVAAPMKPAQDAAILDTSAMNAEQAFTKALEITQKKLAAISH